MPRNDFIQLISFFALCLKLLYVLNLTGEYAVWEKQKQTMKYYRRVMINTDFSIHLFHDSNIVENSGSQLGLRLASSLKEWGSVNHYVWIEALSNF